MLQSFDFSFKLTAVSLKVINTPMDLDQLHTLYNREYVSSKGSVESYRKIFKNIHIDNISNSYVPIFTCLQFVVIVSCCCFHKGNFVNHECS